MAINFNVTPYFDDFDPSKNFHRILFKPGVAIQARELTQSQTILQNQISNFAANIFKQNTPISGGKVTTNLNAYYIKLNTQYSGINIVASSFLNKTITDPTGTVRAKVIATTEYSNGTPPTLVVTYQSGVKFSDGTQIIPTDGSNVFATTIGVTGGSTCTGPSSTASISSGVFYVVSGSNISASTGIPYAIGNFVQVNPQTIILDQFDNSPSLRIGLQITETEVTSSQDVSLLDPAIGASNYQAPGADRYQINLTLTTYPLSLGNDTTFIELVRVSNGQIVKQVDSTVYSTIDDYFAKRDYETNGDYIVKDFKLTPSANALGISSNYDLTIGKGIAYVRGYRIQNQSAITLTAPRAQNTATINTNTVLVDYGNYFYVDTANGYFDVATVPSVDFHSVPAASVNTANANIYNSTLLGSGFIRGLQYVQSGSNTANTSAYIYKAYVHDINTNVLTGTVASATPTTITFNDTANVFSSAANAYYGAVLSITGGTDGPPNYATDTRTIVNYNGATRTANVFPAFTVTPDSTSTFSITFKQTYINSIVQRNGYGFNASGGSTLTANVNINAIFGKTGGSYYGTTVLQNPGQTELIFPLGYPYVAQVSNSSYYSVQTFRNQSFNSSSKQLVLNIPNSTYIQFNGSVGSTYQGDAFKQIFTVISNQTGQILDFTSASSNGSATLTSTSSATITLVNYNSAVHSNVTVLASVYVGLADNARKTKTYYGAGYNGTANTNFVATTNVTGVSNTLISLDGSNNANGQVYIFANGISRNAMSLYTNDVQNIVTIYDTGSATVTPTAGASITGYTNITSNFTLNSGQKDSYYDHSSIQLLPGVPLPGGNIIVVYNYYLHSGGDGYFTSNSYPNYTTIPSYTAKDGATYQLRDSLDFRPTRTKGTNAFTWEYNTGTSSTQGVEIPINLTNFNSIYSYYLARKDKLVLTKDNIFSIVQGTPSLTPVLPKEPNGALVLANLSLDPYTARISTDNDLVAPTNLSLQKVIHKRWAKSDITDLQTQVDNLEYYTALNVLEQNAIGLQTPDVNGINRFKYGILVDNFSSYATAASYDPSFSANINVRTQQLSPVTSVVNFQLQNPAVLNSLGTATGSSTGYSINSVAGTQTNIFMLPYTTANVISQPLASNTISVNPFSVITQGGVASLVPPMDNWVTTQEIPALLSNDPSLQFTQVPNGGLTAIFAGDFQSLVGTSSTVTSTQGIVTAAANNQIFSNQLVGLAQTPTTTTSSALLVNNGFVTNVSVLPYIRPQELTVKAQNMLVNTPVQCWFDGQNVNQYISAPNTIELTNVSGTFLDNQIVGFYYASANTFYPVARIVTSHNYANTSNSRLYVADLVNIPTNVPTTTLINATYDQNGNYVLNSNTASGTVVFKGNSIISLHSSGSVTGIGRYSANGTTVQTYKAPTNSSYSNFLNFYGIWGDQNASGSYNTTATGLNAPYSFNASQAGSYLITASVHNSATIYIDGVAVLTPGVGSITTPVTTTVTLTAGLHNITWNAVSAGGISAIAITIQNNIPSSAAYNNVVWDTLTPTSISASNNSITYLPGGGAYYLSANTISLDKNASNVSGFYANSTISVKSTYVYAYNYGALYIPPYPPLSGDGDAANVNRYNAAKAAYLASAVQTFYGNALTGPSYTGGIYLAATQTYTATVLGYDGPTRTATLSNGVGVSLGVNQQYGPIPSQYTIQGTAYSVAGAIAQGNTLSQLSTNESGVFAGIFNCPGSQFYIGDRVFRVDNRTVASDPGSATTWAEATFYAGTVHATVTNADYSSSVDSSVIPVTPVNNNNNTVVQNSTNTQKYNVDPIAQSFIVDKNTYPNGVFLSSVKLFFYSKPYTNVPIQLSIVGTQNGVPNGQTLDHSTVVLQPQQVNVSSVPSAANAATWTTFTFSAPVYIQPNTLYAMVLRSNSTEYQVYLAQQNATAVPSTGVTKIGAAPYVGALFETQNSITWTADQTKDLMFIIDKCVFNTSITPTIPFTVPYNLPYRKYSRYDILSKTNPTAIPNMNSYFSPSVPMDAINVSTTDFIPSLTNINYSYYTTLYNGFTTTALKPITPGRYGTPSPDNTYLNDGLGERVLLNTQNNSFGLYATLSSSDPNVSPVISDDGLSLYNITYHINNLNITNNCIQIANTGSGYNGNTANLGTITISPPDIGTNTAVLAFTANANTGNITSVYVTYPGSGYIKTPTITINDPTTRGGNSNAVIQFSGETSYTGGNGLAKYITKKVILNAGNDSGDLRVWYTAYKPLGTDVYVYYRILSSSDTSSLDNQNWQPMVQISQLNTYSTNRTNLIEYEFAPGIPSANTNVTGYYSGAANNNIQYTSTNGSTYTNFIQFQIKLVMVAQDPTQVPFLSDVRAIALPSGTYI